MGKPNRTEFQVIEMDCSNLDCPTAIQLASFSSSQRHRCRNVNANCRESTVRDLNLLRCTCKLAGLFCADHNFTAEPLADRFTEAIRETIE